MLYNNKGQRYSGIDPQMLHEPLA